MQSTWSHLLSLCCICVLLLEASDQMLQIDRHSHEQILTCALNVSLRKATGDTLTFITRYSKCVHSYETNMAATEGLNAVFHILSQQALGKICHGRVFERGIKPVLPGHLRCVSYRFTQLRSKSCVIRQDPPLLLGSPRGRLCLSALCKHLIRHKAYTHRSGLP